MAISRLYFSPYLALAALASSLPSRDIVAQSPSRGTASVHGQVLDSLTRRPIPRAWVCRRSETRDRPRCVAGDTLGEYRLDSLPAGTYPITFSCYGKGVFAGGAGDSPPVRLAAGDTVRLDYQIGGGGCDLRPERVLQALFTGLYSSGFEQSDFLFCPDSPWFADADTVGMGPLQRSAWVIWPHDGRFRGEPAKWPKPRLVHPPWNYPEYFIRWVGRLKGPGRYGHMGVSMFELTVDSIVEVRTPRSSDCRRGASGGKSH